MILHGFEITADVTGVGLGVVGCLVHQTGHGVQLFFQDLEGVFFVFDLRGRFHLANNAADFLTALNFSVIAAVHDVADLGSGDTAHIVTHAGVANVCLVFAAADDTAAAAGNAADVGDGVDGFGTGQGIQRNVRNLDLILLGCGVDPGFVGAAADHTQILTGNTAHEVVTVEITDGAAVFDDTGNLIEARDAADPVCAGDGAPKTAV